MLVSLLAVVFFSFAAVTHGSESGMQNDCPFSAMGAPLCPQDLVAAAVHHISAYQSLLNAPVGSGIMAIIIALLMLAYGIFIFFARPPASPPKLIGYFRNSLPDSSRDRETTHWLSLFEHSPSLL